MLANNWFFFSCTNKCCPNATLPSEACLCNRFSSNNSLSLFNSTFMDILRNINGEKSGNYYNDYTTTQEPSSSSSVGLGSGISAGGVFLIILFICICACCPKSERTYPDEDTQRREDERRKRDYEWDEYWQRQKEKEKFWERRERRIFFSFLV